VKLLKTAALSILIFIAFGCSNGRLKPLGASRDPFLDLVAINDMNNSLRISIIYDEHTEYNFGLFVDVLVENISDQEIFLPSNSSVLRAFINKDNAWVEVENGAIYLGNGGILNFKGGVGASWKTLVYPVLGSSLENIGSLTNVRILVVGEFMSKGKKTGKPVAAYVDLIMKR